MAASIVILKIRVCCPTKSLERPKSVIFGTMPLVSNMLAGVAWCFLCSGYMAPEFLHRGKITKKSDIFSLGVIILEMITGNKDYPWSNDTTTVQNYVKIEVQKWRARMMEDLSSTFVENNCQHIKKCIEIGLRCVDNDEMKRPTTKEIIERLNIPMGGSNATSSRVGGIPALEALGHGLNESPFEIANVGPNSSFPAVYMDQGEFEEARRVRPPPFPGAHWLLSPAEKLSHVRPEQQHRGGTGVERIGEDPGEGAATPAQADRTGREPRDQLTQPPEHNPGAQGLLHSLNARLLTVKTEGMERPPWPRPWSRRDGAPPFRFSSTPVSGGGLAPGQSPFSAPSENWGVSPATSGSDNVASFPPFDTTVEGAEWRAQSEFQEVVAACEPLVPGLDIDDDVFNIDIASFFALSNREFHADDDV